MAWDHERGLPFWEDQVIQGSERNDRELEGSALTIRQDLFQSFPARLLSLHLLETANVTLHTRLDQQPDILSFPPGNPAATLSNPSYNPSPPPSYPHRPT